MYSYVYIVCIYSLATTSPTGMRHGGGSDRDGTRGVRSASPGVRGGFGRRFGASHALGTHVSQLSSIHTHNITTMTGWGGGTRGGMGWMGAVGGK